MADVTIVLPTLNEGNSIKRVIQDIKGLSIKMDIVVIDGRSTDRTVAIARALGVKVLYEKRKGKGIAVRKALRMVKTPYVVMIDADGTYPVASIPSFYECLKDYDMVKGNRTWVEKGAMTKTHRFGNWALSLMASMLYRVKVRDVCSGMWAMRSSKIRDFNLVSNGFTFEADLYINVVKTGCKLAELPIEYNKRIQGDKAKLMFTDGLKIGWFLIKKKFK